MIDDIILPFPVLQVDSADFAESVSYSVEASHYQNSLDITHTLSGNSFISQLIRDDKAIFSVALFYKDHAERQAHSCASANINKKDEADKIIAKQKIAVDFADPPEIMASIVLLEESTIPVDDKVGLNDLWQDENSLSIPAYARIAYYPRLQFTSGEISSLIWKAPDDDYADGTLKTVVRENAGQGDRPVTIICARDVSNALDNKTTAHSRAIGKAIITQVLCHVYAYMNNLLDKETDIHGGLLMHLDNLREKTGEDWLSAEDFNPSLAATKMIPYVLDKLNDEADDE